MARRGDHSLEQIKNMILVAAEELVVEKGLSQLRVRSIAVKIGYTVGSIYMVFDSMTDLILHIKGRVLDNLAEEMDSIQTTSAEQHLEDLATVYIRFASQNINRWSMIFEHRLPDVVAMPAWYQRKVDHLFSKFEQQFAFLVPEATPSQRRQAALAFLGGIQGICMLMLTMPVGDLNENDFLESVQALIKRFIPRGQKDEGKDLNSANYPGFENWRPKIAGLR
jgi:AcrR family transcriptional regulator